MRFIRNAIPHLSLALALGLIVLVVLDGFNPLMAFLTSRASKVFILALCLSCIVTSLISIVENRK